MSIDDWPDDYRVNCFVILKPFNVLLFTFVASPSALVAEKLVFTEMRIINFYALVPISLTAFLFPYKMKV